MNQQTLDFISNHWQLLLHSNVNEFSPLVSSSSLQSVALILNALRSGSLTTIELSDCTGLHPNSISSITRVLDGKLFDRSAQGTDKGASTLVSLSVQAIEQLSRITTNTSQAIIPPKAGGKTGMYLTYLPEKQFYRAIPSKKEGQWVFEDCDCPTFRIVSPKPDPWGKQWVVWTAKQRQKSSREPLNTRVDFRLYPIGSKDKVIAAQIERETIKGYFAWAIDRPLEFFVAQIGDRLYLSYSFVQI
jgi:hypothetical protein